MSDTTITQTRRTTPRVRRVKAGLMADKDGRRAEVEDLITTTDEEAECRALVADMAREFAGLRKFYRDAGGRTKEEVERDAESLTAYRREQAKDMPVRELTWGHIGAVADVDMQGAVDLWRRVQHAADDELESGIMPAQSVGAKTPIERARFLAIRNKFLDDWQPRGGIEAAMVDTLAQCFSLQLYWTEIAHSRAVNTAEFQREEVARYTGGSWKLPAQHEADAIEQAHRMADRYNRMFLRTLRQMRDLRRYAPPVIVNNGGQVNVGQQQVNVATGI